MKLVLFLIVSHILANEVNYSLIESGSLSNQTEKYTFKVGFIDDKKEPFFSPNIFLLQAAVLKLRESQCRQASLHVLEALGNRERWAIQMFDSSTKLPEGVLFGSRYQMGNFDECLSINSNSNIFGKYCLVSTTLNNSAYFFSNRNQSSRSERNKSELLWSICVPSLCSDFEIKNFLTFVFEFALSKSNVSISIQVIDNLCTERESIPNYTAFEIVYGISIMSMIISTLLCTFIHIIYVYYYDKNPAKNPKMILKLIISFSLLNSIRKILISKSERLSVEFISGIKVIFMTLILIGHSCIFFVSGPVSNDNYYKKAILDLKNILIVNNPLMVDTFLFLSGFLVCKILLFELDKRKGKVNILVIYVGRYLRLTPVYAVVIFFYSTWFKYLNDGPLWNYRILKEQERCQHSWWTNLLYVNNYVNTDYICMFQSWYLAVDTQLFLIAPIFIYTLWHRKQTGIVLLFIGTIFAVLSPFLITFVNRLDPTFMAYAPEIFDLSQNEFFVNVYIKTHMRAISYFFGLICGFILHELEQNSTKLSKFRIIMIWLLSITLAIMSLCSLNYFYQTDYQYSAIEAALYSIFHRIGWFFAISWLIIACATNNAGPIKNFLSWKPFIVLARLTYCAYLSNGVVLLLSQGMLRHPAYISTLTLVYRCMSEFLLTFLFALVLCVFFESPILGIEKILLQKV